MSGHALPLFSDHQHSALQTAAAILAAYDRRILQMDAAYMAETLRMLLAALTDPDVPGSPGTPGGAT